MVSTALAIEQFPQTMEKYSAKEDKSRIEEIASTIETIRTQNPAAYDERRVNDYLRQRAGVLKDLVEDYFTASMASEFPLISEEIFGLKRYITLRRGEDEKLYVVRDDTERLEEPAEEGVEEHLLEVPLFAYTRLFKGKHNAKLGEHNGRHKNYTEKVSIDAKLPGVVGPNLKNAHREAVRHYFATLAEMFSNTVASDILYSGGKLGEPEVGAMWIPTLESLEVTTTKELIRPVVRDPAMILTARDKRFLVQTWQVDDEEPFEHYLREFSTGDLKGKLGSPLRRIK